MRYRICFPDRPPPLAPNDASEKVTDLILFGVISTSVAAAGLAMLPNFRSDRMRFRDRVFYFRWRDCLPIWAFEEIILRVFYGRFYP
jgi:hypothetical protein